MRTATKSTEVVTVLHDVTSAAKYVGIGKNAIRKAAAEGLLTHVRIGVTYKFRLKDLDEFIEKLTIKATK